MSRILSNKFVVFLFLFLIALFLEFNWKAAFGWSPEFIMAILVVMSFYSNVLEMAVISAIGIFIFNWQPAFDYEILIFFLIPFLNLFARKIFPWRSEVNNILGIILSVSIFYSIFNSASIIANFSLFAWIVFITACFGAATFQILNYFYKIS